jgi:hypothetical protein
MPHNPLRIQKSLIPEFFIILVIVTAVAFLANIRDEQIKSREQNVAQREADLAKREAELASREREDMLTPFRRSLEGVWELEFHRWEYDKIGNPRSVPDFDHARFKIDEKTGKLSINVAVREGSGYRRDELNIDAI